MSLRKRVAASATLNPVPDSRAMVKPVCPGDDTGCLWCPLAPMHADFAAHQTGYGRDADKIMSKLAEPHVIRNRNVAEPWDEVDVLFVGDSTGVDEDKQGLPFVGRAGGMLRTALLSDDPKYPGIYRQHAPDAKVGFTNVVRCRAPLNRKPNKTEVKSCSPELIREIKARKPKLIVATGNYSLELLTGQTGITMLAGKFLKATHPELEGMDVLGCYHPSYVLMMDHELDNFFGVLKKSADFINGEIEQLPGPGEYFVLDTMQQVVQLFRDFEKEKKKIAFDTETGSLSPFQTTFPKLLCFSFCNTPGTAYVIPFDHKDSPWRKGGIRENERHQLIRILQAFFTNEKVAFRKRAQNEKFDRQHIREAIGVELVDTDGDTMSTHLTIDERRGSHGLKILSYAATGMGGYEKTLEDYIDKHKDCDPDCGGSYANIPGSLLFWYAGADADCTLRVDEWLENHPDYVGNVKFQRLARDYFPKLSATLARMEYAGAQVDSAVVARLDAKYTAEMAAAEAKVKADPMVQKYVALKTAEGEVGFEFNPASVPQLRTVLFDLYGLKPTELTDKGFDILTARYRRLKEEAKKIRGASEPSFTELVNAEIKAKNWSLFTTDAEALHEYERMKNPLATAILEYRGVAVLHSTFVVPLQTMLDPMGRIHGNFNIIGTVTGRLSSNNPNLQNIPNKGGGIIKQAYVSRFGDQGVILNVDFSQIELRIAAAYFNEPKMRDVYLNKKDLHKLTAAVISGNTMEQFDKLHPDVKKAWRTRAKRVNFGVLYGGGPPALQATLKKDGVFVTLEECQEFIDKFFKAYPGLRKGMDDLEAAVKKHGYLESFTGRRRRVPEAFSEDRELVSRAIRQSVNFPIQSGAGDMTLMSLILIERVLMKEGFRSIPILTVHDSIVFDCHVDEFVQVAQIAKEIMETIPQLSEEVLPGLDWKWLNVPIVAECEAGPSWGVMVEFEPAVLTGEEEGEDADKPLIAPNEKGKDEIKRKPTSIDEMWDAFAFKLKKAA